MLSLLTVVLLACLLFSATAKKAMDMDAYNKRTGAKYLADIAKKESVVTLKSGMLIEIITPSSYRNAVSPTVADTCDVTYRCEKGKKSLGRSFEKHQLGSDPCLLSILFLNSLSSAPFSSTLLHLLHHAPLCFTLILVFLCYLLSAVCRLMSAVMI
jgi:hypothetical protein